MYKKIITIMLVLTVVFGFTACGGNNSDGEKTEVKIFAAASLKPIMEEFENNYEKENPDIDIVISADSSGTLMEQIKEGAPCDIFFSAGQSQMDELEGKDLVVKDTRKNVVNNQLAVITQPDSNTAVKNLKTIGKAKSIALADGSVPVGKYTRQALMNLGILKKTDDPSAYATKQVSDALGGVEISEQGNVSKVLTAVQEGSCEVGTVYLSDTYGHEDSVKIIEKVSYDTVGNIIYPIAQIKNPDAKQAETDAAAAFLGYLTGNDAKQLYEQYLFDTNVK